MTNTPPEVQHLVALMRRLYVCERDYLTNPHNGKKRQADALAWALRHFRAAMPDEYARAERIANSRSDQWSEAWVPREGRKP